MKWKEILRQEFEAADGSFLILLRTKGWSWEAYRRLFGAMLDCCKEMDGKQRVERWIAEGFWYLSRYPATVPYVKGDRAMENAVVNFDHLAHWFFVGEGRRDDQFEPVIVSGQNVELPTNSVKSARL